MKHGLNFLRRHVIQMTHVGARYPCVLVTSIVVLMVQWGHVKTTQSFMDPKGKRERITRSFAQPMFSLENSFTFGSCRVYGSCLENVGLYLCRAWDQGMRVIYFGPRICRLVLLTDLAIRYQTRGSEKKLEKPIKNEKDIRCLRCSV